MATMWPRAIPSEIRANPLRRAECRVFDRLEEELSDEYEVFYSRPWLGLDRLGEEIDGECDFVVAHNNYGFLALEVKGGGISRDPESEKWYTIDRYKIKIRIKNPVQQAVTSKHKILEKLKELDKNLGWIRNRHGVVFPDASEFSGNLGTDIPKSIVCCEKEFEYAFGRWVEERLKEPDAGGHSLGEGFRSRGICCLRELLAKPIHLTIPLGKLLKNDDHELQVLSQQQYHILDLITQIERVAISGGAGAGKTILAIEEAVRLSKSGKKTALLCFNRGLASSFTSLKKVADVPNLTTSTFHSLLWTAVGNPAHSDHFTEDIPTQAMIQGAIESGKLPMFDALVIDEGQDFPPEWWDSLLLLLRSNGLLRVFWDSNQSVYSSMPTFPEGTRPIPIVLNRNFRNTKSIWDLAKSFYVGPAIEPMGPVGQTPSLQRLQIKTELIQAIQKLVTEWLLDTIPESLAILVPDSAWRDQVSNQMNAVGIKVRKCDELIPGTITVDTIRRFKGLESRDVILVLDERSASSRELSYVGLTRARVRLAVYSTVSLDCIFT